MEKECFHITRIHVGRRKNNVNKARAELSILTQIRGLLTALQCMVDPHPFQLTIIQLLYNVTVDV